MKNVFRASGVFPSCYWDGYFYFTRLTHLTLQTIVTLLLFCPANPYRVQGRSWCVTGLLPPPPSHPWKMTWNYWVKPVLITSINCLFAIRTISFMDLPAIRLMGDTYPLSTFSTTINVPYCQPPALSGRCFYWVVNNLSHTPLALFSFSTRSSSYKYQRQSFTLPIDSVEQFVTSGVALLEGFE